MDMSASFGLVGYQGSSGRELGVVIDGKIVVPQALAVKRYVLLKQVRKRHFDF